MPVGIVDTVGGDLPLRIGGGAAVGVAPSDVDVFIDRLPFWLSIDGDNPYQRETAQFQREQVDQQPEAGEQSLAGWWTRSQMSFHFGAGLDYLDTTARPQPEDRVRFKTSRNVDPWTPGTLKRLNGTTLNRASLAAEPVWLDECDAGLIAATPSKVEVWNGSTWTARPYGSANPIKAFCTDGVNYYVATIDGVWKDTIAGSTTATKVYSLPGTSVPMCLGWVKQRLMLGHGPSVYSLDAAGPALPTAKMVQPTASWTWTAFTDSPSGILACGYAGLSSAVYAFKLDDVAGTPTLGAGITLMTLPAGEKVLSALYYMGAELIVGTNRGVRVCAFNSYYGTVSMGPLVVQTGVDIAGPVTALGGYDRYVYAGTQVNGETALIRIDLSAQLDQAGHYAWAPDLVFPTGLWTDTVTSIAFLSTGRKAVGVTGRGTVMEDAATNPSDAAWLQTARIRMGTVEDKHWASVTLRGTYGDIAPIGVSIADPVSDGFESAFVTAASSAQRYALHRNQGEWIALRFDLSEGAELASYQVQALPAGNRQRLISLPVSCFDYQQTRSGQEVGYDGWALERLADLESLEKSGAPIGVTAPALFPDGITAVIEKLTYVQRNDPGDQGSGTGGLLQVILRTTL